MIALIILSALIGKCIGTPLTAVWLSPVAPVPPLTRYQSQDGLGSYHYAYTGPHHSKVETRLGGLTQGGYSYIDANGILQTVAYTADALNGFRVHASNLPQQPKDELKPVKDTPEVEAAKQVHLEELRKSGEIQNQGTTGWQLQRLPSNPQQLLDYPNSAAAETDNKLEAARPEVGEIAPMNPFLLSKIQGDKIAEEVPTIAANFDAPSVPSSNFNYLFQDQAHKRFQGFAPQPNLPHYVFPVLPYRLMHSSLRHTQDSLGQYDYTYAGDTSAKTESRTLDGTTRGAYSYIDANGILQQVHYVADHNGFRVAATNLPEAK